MLFQYDHKWNPWSHVAALQIWNFSLSLVFCVVGYHFWMTLDVHTYPNITIITSWCPHRSFCVRFNLANFFFCDFQYTPDSPHPPPPPFFKLHSPSWPFPLYPPHLIIPPLQAETVPHLLLNSLRMLSYHLQWKEHREDKRVRGNTVWRMLFISRHEITCQFGSEREQSNTILITLADVKERLSPWFSSWQCPKNGSGWVSMILYIYLYVCVPEYMHTVSAVAGNKWQVTCRWTLKIK